MEKVDEDASLEFKWLIKRGIGGKKKEVRFYGSFIYDGVEYVLYDCVYMYAEGLREPYIGKLTKIWENADKAKKVKIHWFFRPEEISNWLGDTKTLENEIFFASGEGVGLSNINPLEAIAGKCNVVCVSKDSNNPQPSHDQLKAADFVFYRTFDVGSCTVSDRMDEKVGGIGIQYIFNKREEASISTLPETSSDKKEENQKAITCSEQEKVLTKNLPNNLKDDTQITKDKDDTQITTLVEKTNSKILNKAADKDDKEVGANKMEANKRKKTPADSDKLQNQPSKKTKVDDKNPLREKKPEDEVSRTLVENTNSKILKMSAADKDGKEGSANKMEANKRKKTPAESDKLQDQPSKKTKVDDKTPLKEKQMEVEVPRDSQKMTSKKSKVKNSIKSPVNDMKGEKNSEMSKKSDKADKDKDKDETKVSKERKKSPSEFDKSDERPPKKMKSPPQVEVEVGGGDIERMTDLPSKVDGLSKDEDKLEEKQMVKNDDKGKISDELEGRKLKKAKGEGSFKVANDKKVNTNINGSNNKEDHNNKRKQDMYKEFEVTPKPNAEKSIWFKRLPWEESLKNAYEQGTAILLHNLDPDYTSPEVEYLIWHAFTENCEAKILPHSAISSPHCYQALVLFKTKEAAQKVLAKLDEECLMLSNKRPLVATPCPPIIPRKNSKFFGFLSIDRIKITQRETEEAVSTSHFSQPNTIEYDMAMEWFYMQSKSEKWWERFHKVKGNELKRLEAKIVKE